MASHVGLISTVGRNTASVILGQKCFINQPRQTPAGEVACAEQQNKDITKEEKMAVFVFIYFHWLLWCRCLPQSQSLQCVFMKKKTTSQDVDVCVRGRFYKLPCHPAAANSSETAAISPNTHNIHPSESRNVNCEEVTGL